MYLLYAKDQEEDEQQHRAKLAASVRCCAALDGEVSERASRQLGAVYLSAQRVARAVAAPGVSQWRTESVTSLMR